MALPERKTAILLIVEDDRDMRSLLCDEFWGRGTSFGRRGVGMKPFCRFCNAHRT